MKPSGHRNQRPDYGVDLPNDLRRNGLYGLLGLVMGILLFWLASGGAIGIFLSVISLGSGLLLIAVVAISYWGSTIGKVKFRDDTIARLPWRGDELVLDIGCGHGLMMVGAARHLTTGKAIGIDLFLKEDQLGNDPEAAMLNASLEGVADRVEVRRGDARDLPYNDNSFDVVMSSWVLHSLLETEDRIRALKEIARTVKPGGRVLIIDIDRVNEYVTFFLEKGWSDVSKSRPNFLFVNPSYTIVAIKPTA
jgi:arsenite methyltransferase